MTPKPQPKLDFIEFMAETGLAIALLGLFATIYLLLRIILNWY